MSIVTLQHLLDACRPGGASVLTSVTPLEPAAGLHASVAPAKFVSGSKSVFASERRFWNGEAVTGGSTLSSGPGSAIGLAVLSGTALH